MLSALAWLIHVSTHTTYPTYSSTDITPLPQPVHPSYLTALDGPDRSDLAVY